MNQKTDGLGYLIMSDYECALVGVELLNDNVIFRN